ncbi:HEWD family protein [Halorussus salinisoli]|uniref:HEWD family protein n=1 Tax=Halorussus salinisoli TaxID=2558242 RepID=UPI0014853EFD|nr:HEWD family protein [Halorussus salinisoli]
MIQLDPPRERECQRCGRRDVWDDEVRNWRIQDDSRAGDPFCIHEWDINGAYQPIRG